MSRFVLWSLQLSTIAVGGTGLIYAWMLYLCDPIDEWAVVNHPAQGTFQALHILLAPAMLFCLGAIWR
ncbi:MAG: hypothetical protein ACYTG5_22265, partial [Planctomycetota bacterium]